MTDPRDPFCSQFNTPENREAVDCCRLDDVKTRRAGVLAAVAETSYQIAMVFTGGGTGMIGHCFARPGASKNFLEGTVPYARDSVADYLGTNQEVSAASAAAAEQLAARAFERASRFAGHETQPVGLALVAALPTAPPRRGQDRVHVTLHTEKVCRTWSIELPAGQHTRESAESVAEELVLLAFSRLIGCDATGSTRFLSGEGLNVVEVAS